MILFENLVNLSVTRFCKFVKIIYTVVSERLKMFMFFLIENWCSVLLIIKHFYTSMCDFIFQNERKFLYFLCLGK